jgi:hypothetical protein
MLAADHRSAGAAIRVYKCSGKLEPIHQRIYSQRSGTSSHTNTIAKCIRYYIEIKD